MAKIAGLDVHEVTLTIRFVQGYRYLDRCGATLIELENALGEGWLPSDPTPKGGAIKNTTKGMTAQFSSDYLQVALDDFQAIEEFISDACRIYDVLWKAFEIKHLLAPSLRVQIQKGFETSDEADAWVVGLASATPSSNVVEVLDGTPGIVQHTFVTEADVTWQDTPMRRRRRLNLKSLRQKRSQLIDNRMLRRARLLPKRQRDAIQALWKLKEHRTEIPPNAAQLEFETSLEEELETKRFDLPGFITDMWTWVNAGAKTLVG